MPVEFRNMRAPIRENYTRGREALRPYRESQSKRSYLNSAKLMLAGLTLFAGSSCVGPQLPSRIKDANGHEWELISRKKRDKEGKPIPEFTGEGKFFDDPPIIGAFGRTFEEMNNGGLFGIFSFPIHLLGNATGILGVGHPSGPIFFPNQEYLLVEPNRQGQPGDNVPPVRPGLQLNVSPTMPGPKPQPSSSSSPWPSFSNYKQDKK